MDHHVSLQAAQPRQDQGTVGTGEGPLLSFAVVHAYRLHPSEPVLGLVDQHVRLQAGQVGQDEGAEGTGVGLFPDLAVARVPFARPSEALFRSPMALRVQLQVAPV